MAEKILNLRLKYKNKFLDTAIYKRDFNKSFLIGRNKNIFWQILDSSFPEKHTLITKKDDDFYLHLLPDMNISVMKDGKFVTEDELKQKNQLSEKVLKLERDTEGAVKFAKSWSVEYYYKTPYIPVRSQEDIAIFSQFHKWEELTNEQKFTRAFLIIALIITFIGSFIIEKTYQPPSRIDFRDRLRSIEQQATLIQPEFQEDVQQKVETVTSGFERATSAQAAGAQTAAATAKSMAEFEREFGALTGVGGASGGAEDLSGALFETNVIGTKFVESSDGRGGMPDIGLSLPKAGQGTSVLESAGRLGDLSDFSGLGDLGIGTGVGGFETVDVASLGGNLGDYKTVRIKGKAEFDAIKRSFSGIRTIKEDDIKLVETPEARTELASIDQQVQAQRPQINQLYRIESMMTDMYGTIEFEIIIGANGKVMAVDYNVAKGSFFTPDFLEKASQIVTKWNIKVKEAIGYKFRVTYLKQ
jgi:hypothetical protein